MHALWTNLFVKDTLYEFKDCFPTIINVSENLVPAMVVRYMGIICFISLVSGAPKEYDYDYLQYYDDLDTDGVPDTGKFSD